jgi:hypothetical protein
MYKLSWTMQHASCPTLEIITQVSRTKRNAGLGVSLYYLLTYIQGIWRPEVYSWLVACKAAKDSCKHSRRRVAVFRGCDRHDGDTSVQSRVPK